MLRICPSHQSVSTLAYDSNAAVGTSRTGTGNAHHYHINGSVFKVLIGPLFTKFSANYEIYGLQYAMSLNEATVRPNAHATLKSCKSNVLFQGQPRPANGRRNTSLFLIGDSHSSVVTHARPLRVSANNTLVQYSNHPSLCSEMSLCFWRPSSDATALHLAH
jgi:hypothetical protein